MRVYTSLRNMTVCMIVSALGAAARLALCACHTPCAAASHIFALVLVQQNFAKKLMAEMDNISDTPEGAMTLVVAASAVLSDMVAVVASTIVCPAWMIS